jgi:hypothetical protein
MPVKLKKSEGILATAAKASDLQTAYATASKAAKILGCPALKKVDDKIWGPKMVGKKAEFVIDGKPDNEALNLTVKLHIGSEYSTLAIVKKTAEELKNDAIMKALKASGLM